MELSLPLAVVVLLVRATLVLGTDNYANMTEYHENQFIQHGDIYPVVDRRKRSILGKLLTHTSNLVGKSIQDQERSQCHMLPEQLFPCKHTRSSRSVPTSVHMLRPADIQVVGALGDSITAGVGARAQSVLDIAKEYGEVSFSVGGQATWREVITLPNILKIFNPNLYGASQAGDGGSRGFNYARPGATSIELLSQAKRLVRDMQRDPNIRIQEDWKMITILIGHNDACTHACNATLGVKMYEDASATGYQNNIRITLDYLHSHLPRTFVNLVHMADVTMSLDLKHKPAYCHALHWYFCPCLFDAQFSKRMTRNEMKLQQRAYMVALRDLIDTGRYDTREDFTVVLQPSLVNGELPKRYYWLWRARLPDLSYLAPDCFHFSQKLHALVSRSLWNNLLQPVGQKSTDWSKEVPFLCPSPTAPFLATSQNSGLARRIRGSLMADWLAFIRGTKNYLCTL